MAKKPPAKKKIPRRNRRSGDLAQIADFDLEEPEGGGGLSVTIREAIVVLVAVMPAIGTWYTTKDRLDSLVAWQSEVVKERATEATSMEAVRQAVALDHAQLDGINKQLTQIAADVRSLLLKEAPRAVP